ncbi:MAG TPA: hypothetical protein VGP47_11175 [Parachlamydiaceae bacterium]|nr:hypothetical protein [Parachlamydiaceae bacterium]
MKQINVPLTIAINSKLKHSALMLPGYTPDFQLKAAKIKLSDKINEEPLITRLAFEISNVIEASKLTSFMRSTRNGDIGMDEYAAEIELSEINSKKNTYTAQLKCGKHADFEPSVLSHAMNKLSFEEHLWYQDVECHTDIYRTQWVKEFQKNYCLKNPRDVKSCQTSLKDLCDIYALNKMSKVNHLNMIHKRICERFSTAPPYFQKQFDSIIEETCPEVKQTASVNYTNILLGTATTAIIAFLAAKCFMH